MSDSESYIVPNGFFFTKDHEWLKPSQGSYLVGITDYAAKMLNDIVYVNLPKEGDSFKEGRLWSGRIRKNSFRHVHANFRIGNQNKFQIASRLQSLFLTLPMMKDGCSRFPQRIFPVNLKCFLDASAYRAFILSLKDST